MIAIQYCQRMFQAVLKFQFLEHVPFFGEITLPPIKSKRFLAVAPLFLSEYLIIIEPKSAAFETFNPFFNQIILIVWVILGIVSSTDCHDIYKIA